MIVCVADFFTENLIGEAELTTEAILKPSREHVVKILSENLDLEFIKKYENAKWIIGNLTRIDKTILDYISSSSLEYHFIEYDYKCCILRMPEYHKRVNGNCCKENTVGETIIPFFLNAKTLWFMSKGQKEWYENEYPAFKDHENSYVLSSIFDEQTINAILSMDCTNKNNVYLIQQSPHPLKGTEQGIQYAKDNNLEYELFSKLPYEQVLEKFAQSRGFIFLPTEFDTCPRVTIEAKMLGCDVITNENVQHRDEEWFNKDSSSIVSHMRERLEFFWNTI